MTTWMKPRAAAKYAAGVNVKIVYAAIAAGHLKVARIGAGRNMLTCEQWVDEWLRGRATGHVSSALGVRAS